MGFMVKIFYMAVLLFTLVQAPGQVAAMLLDHSATHTSMSHYNISYTSSVDQNTGYGQVCQSLNTIQASAKNKTEARALGFYRDLISSAGRSAGYASAC